ncbi:MAG TPA: histidine triad nucleotide-binding protein [Firmicutes bacterium]|nr:histidine triad nucleotide-binding protein [Bacillota bacterium]HBT17244.1 histidine triad nucleotide-binding protein [Bacillota bacterium]
MDECIFCQIARKAIPAKILLENEEIIAFQDINPVAPVHILLVPKKHISSIMDPKLSEDPELTTKLFSAIQEIAEETKINQEGFRVVINRGVNAGETVPHLHFHLIGGRELSWPPG